MSRNTTVRGTGYADRTTPELRTELAETRRTFRELVTAGATRTEIRGCAVRVWAMRVELENRGIIE